MNADQPHGTGGRFAKVSVKCARCGCRVLKPNATLCHHCGRQVSADTVQAERQEAHEVEPTTLPPIAAEKLIEQWGRA